MTNRQPLGPLDKHEMSARKPHKVYSTCLKFFKYYVFVLRRS